MSTSGDSPRVAVPAPPVLSHGGLTLLEVMVALVILGIVATGFLETFARALRSTAEARRWVRALVYAEAGQEMVKIEGPARAAASQRDLGGGFSRRIAMRPWRAGIDRVTVTVTLPDGARFEVQRLVPAP
jgi:prepilin-type N-terminal cleavage/methylation domain-containing protein